MLGIFSNLRQTEKEIQYAQKVRQYHIDWKQWFDIVDQGVYCLFELGEIDREKFDDFYSKFEMCKKSILTEDHEIGI